MTQEASRSATPVAEVPSTAEGTTTVVTIGLTPPLIGGGLALGYVGVRRVAGAIGKRRAGAPKTGATVDIREGAASVSAATAGVVGAAADAVGEIGGSAGRAVGSATQRTRQAGQSAAAAAARVGSTTAERMGKVPQAIQENPALAAGLGLAVGTAIALILPATRREREILAPATGTIAHQVRTGVEDTVEKVQLVADEAGSTIKETASEVGLIPVASSAERQTEP